MSASKPVRKSQPSLSDSEEEEQYELRHKFFIVITWKQLEEISCRMGTFIF
jgi:hypothetical protein